MNLYHELAEAMRKGAALRPQTTREYFGFKNGALCSCALGAAYEGIAKRTNQDIGILDVRDMVFGRQPEPVHVRCPVSDCAGEDEYSDHLLDVVVHLNDSHHWTREAIADWLDTL